MTALTMEISAGLPITRRIVVTLPTDRDWWLTADQFEVHMQLRDGRNTSTKLIKDLKQFLTVTLDGDEIEIYFFMSGADTRALGKGGYFDILVSDPGTTDARAHVVLEGQFKYRSIVTASEEGDL